MIQPGGVIEVVDDVDGVIDRDADRDDGKAGGDGGEMRLPDGDDHAGHGGAEERREKRDEREPAPAKRGEAQHEHRAHAEEDAARGVALDQRGVIHGHAMAAGDGDVNAGKLFAHRTRELREFADERFALAGVGRWKVRLGHQQDVASIAAGDAAVDDLRFAETSLQRENFV